MAELHERDMMRCRWCGREERASEGYPCQHCGTFLCLICSFQGVTHCAACAARLGIEQPRPAGDDGLTGGTSGGVNGGTG